MGDAIFEHPRLAAIYDALDPDRADLDGYAAIVADLGARRVLDVGCGTGTFALQLAAAGLEVTALDPADGSLRVARAKPGAAGVVWVHGDATTLPPLRVDAATMTANVAQAILDLSAWAATLRGVHAALRPGGHLVFETREPTDPRMAALDPSGLVRRHRRRGRGTGGQLGGAHRRQRPAGPSAGLGCSASTARP